MAKTHEETIYQVSEAKRSRERNKEDNRRLELYKKQLEIKAKVEKESQAQDVFTVGGSSMNVNLNITIDSSMTSSKLQELLDVINNKN